MKELKSHTLDFDALEGWCGNFYTRRTQISKTRVLLLILHFWETEKKKEGEEEERRKKKKRIHYPRQNQTHPMKSPTKPKPTYSKATPPILISAANRWWISRLGRWLFFLVQVCLCFLSFSPTLHFFFKILRATLVSMLRSWFLGWRRRMKKEVESGFCSWVFQSRNSSSTWILNPSQLYKHMELKFLRLELL